MPDLKPCPFCGGEAEIGFVFGRAGVMCNECNCTIRCDLGSTPQDAADEWNTRAELDSSETT